VGPFDIDTKLTQIFTTGLFGYRAVDVRWPALLGLEPENDTRRLRVDLFTGIRYYYMEVETDIESPPIEIPPFQVTSSLSGGSVRVGGSRIPPQTVAIGRVQLPDVEFPGLTFGGADIHAEASDWWIDPLLGVRFITDVSEKVSLVLSGNVGGFGIGSASTFSWEGTLFANYRFGESWSFAAGYRGLGFEHDSGELTLDLIEHGPLIGLIYRF
jgi:hypothetical protein